MISMLHLYRVLIADTLDSSCLLIATEISASSHYLFVYMSLRILKKALHLVIVRAITDMVLSV